MITWRIRLSLKQTERITENYTMHTLSIPWSIIHQQSFKVVLPRRLLTTVGGIMYPPRHADGCIFDSKFRVETCAQKRLGHTIVTSFPPEYRCVQRYLLLKWKAKLRKSGTVRILQATVLIYLASIKQIPACLAFLYLHRMTQYFLSYYETQFCNGDYEGSKIGFQERNAARSSRSAVFAA